MVRSHTGGTHAASDYAAALSSRGELLIASTTGVGDEEATIFRDEHLIEVVKGLPPSH